MAELFQDAWVLFGLLTPAVVALVAFAFATQPRRPGLDVPRMRAAWALAISGAFLVGLIAGFGQPSLMVTWLVDLLPTQGEAEQLRWQDWLLLLTLGMLAIEMVGATGRGGAYAAWSLRVVLLIAAPLLLLTPISQDAGEGSPWGVGLAGEGWLRFPVLGLEPGDPRRWIFAFAPLFLLLVLGGEAMERLKAFRGGRDLPLALILLCGVTGGIIALSGSLSLMQAMMSMAAVIAGAAIFVPALPKEVAGIGVATPGLFLYACLLLVAQQYTYGRLNEAPGWAILLAVGPLLGFLAALPLPLVSSRPWLRGALRIVLMVLPAVVVLVWFAMTGEDDGY